MAPGSRSCGRRIVVCFCTVMLLLVVVEQVHAAGEERHQRETAVAGSKQAERYLRGNTVTTNLGIVATELEGRYESFEEFERRELLDYTPRANCDNDPTLCPPPSR